MPPRDLPVRFGSMLSPVLIHVPHASIVIPDEVIGDFFIDPEELCHQQLRLTDWFTDELFTAGFPPGQVLTAPVSRLVVDVERFPDDSVEPCSKVGMGATYLKTVAGRPLRSLSPERRQYLLDTYYWPHHPPGASGPGRRQSWNCGGLWQVVPPQTSNPENIQKCNVLRMPFGNRWGGAPLYWRIRCSPL